MTLIPPFFMDCVVAIGADNSEGKRDWIASGFLYAQYARDLDSTHKEYRAFLVTNRHVFQGLSNVYLRFNPQSDEPAREYGIVLLDADGRLLWVAHPNPDIDVAVLPIDFRKLQEHAMRVACFQSDQHVATIQKMNELGVTEGDFGYVLGFPMGLVGNTRNTVIVRSAVIARIRDALLRKNSEYLIDAAVFPGNSGGPVVSKPEVVSIVGTSAQSSALLIGIVKGYVPYQDVAISLQTHRPRVMFEENSGLASVHPIDFVQEAIGAQLKSASITEKGRIDSNQIRSFTETLSHT